MTTFFPHPSQILVDHSQKLKSFYDKEGKVKTKFDPSDLLQQDFIKQCAQSVTDRLAELQNIDTKIALGFGTGISALVLSFVLPFSAVAIAGFAFGAYYMGRRQQAYAEYSFALENLSRCCIWSLGVVGRNAKEVQKNDAIDEMMAVLAPLTDKTQLADFIDDSVEDGFIAGAEKRKGNTVAFDQRLEQDQVALYFKIYGYKQGGFTAILQGIGYAILSAFKGISSKIAGPSVDDAVAVAAAKP